MARHGAHIPDDRTFGQRAADIVAARSGWWPCILTYLAFTVLYLVVNHWVWHFDPTLQFYTFAVSVAAIFLSQVILLAGNRQSEVDRAHAEAAYRHIDALLGINEQQMDYLETLVQRGNAQHGQILERIDRLEAALNRPAPPA
jgi:uncharacterized membrane protein